MLEALQGGEWDADDDGAELGLDGGANGGGFEVNDWDEGLEDDDEGQMFNGDAAAQLETLLGDGSGWTAGDEQRSSMRAALLGDAPQFVHLEADGEASAPTTKQSGNKGQDEDEDDDDEEDDTWRIKGKKGRDDGSSASGFASSSGAPPGETGMETDDDVEALQAMVLKLQATRDLGADLPMAERRRIARAAVQKVMKEMG